MRLATMVAGDFCDVRCGRITHAMKMFGWRHNAVSRGYPPQFEDEYEHIDWHPYRKGFVEALTKKNESELFHVHGELHHYFPVLDAKETGKPVILNVHDLTCSRSASILDAFEAECISAADAHVWVTEEQREFAGSMGLDISKPYCVIPNYVSSKYLIEKPVLPHLGGICYEGGIDPRGYTANDRDFSPFADALGDDFHIYPGSKSPDYGQVHETELEYVMLLHRLAQHDWGLAGYHEPAESWLQSDPTKAYDYLAAGIPVIAMNTPKLAPLVEDGLAVWADSIKDVKQILTRMDTKDYKKRVLANRRKYTTERVIEPLVRLYEEVLA